MEIMGPHAGDNRRKGQSGKWTTMKEQKCFLIESLPERDSE